MRGPNAQSPVSPFATRVTQARAALDFYIGVKEHVVHSGFAWEIDWQEQLSLEKVTESHILREQAWVVLSSGMRATVVAGLFARVSPGLLRLGCSRHPEESRSLCNASPASVRSRGQNERHRSELPDACARGARCMEARASRARAAMAHTVPIHRSSHLLAPREEHRPRCREARSTSGENGAGERNARRDLVLLAVRQDDGGSSCGRRPRSVALRNFETRLRGRGPSPEIGPWRRSRDDDAS